MRHLLRTLAAGAAALTLCVPAHGARLKELCEVQGVRGNLLKGVGLVVGLNGTGDDSPSAIRAQTYALERMGFELKDFEDVASANAALVMVHGTLPAYAKEGTRIDVRVMSVNDAESLQGGVLMETQLEGMDGKVYAVAQGPLSVGGFNADGGGADVRQNHPTVGNIPMGAYVEREVPSTITDGKRLTLSLKDPDFTTAADVQNVINDTMGDGTAFALGAGAVQVRIPPGTRSLVGFIAELEQLAVDAKAPTKVVLNSRTGTVVVGGNVMILPCQVAHGNLTIEIDRELNVYQPEPLAGGETVVTETTDIDVETEEGFLMPVEGTSAADVATALNRLKVTPRDLISIFQALREAGALVADLEVM
jgi:flagellar P-ring protein precursor FlgI